MKINIQNLEQDLLELDADVRADFLDTTIRKFYPNSVAVHVLLDKFGKNYKLDVRLQTKALYICDRCLAEYEAEFSAKQRQVFHIGAQQEPVSDQIEELPANATEIDLDPYLREIILLNHPVKMLCREDCKGICPECGADLNHEACRCSEAPIDPRWAELKKLLK